MRVLTEVSRCLFGGWVKHSTACRSPNTTLLLKVFKEIHPQIHPKTASPPPHCYYLNAILLICSSWQLPHITQHLAPLSKWNQTLTGENQSSAVVTPNILKSCVTLKGEDPEASLPGITHRWLHPVTWASYVSHPSVLLCFSWRINDKSNLRLGAAVRTEWVWWL